MKKNIFILILLLALVATLPVAYGYDDICCDNIDNVGNIWVDTEQGLSLMTEIPSCYNYVKTTDVGDQSILAVGIGDKEISVSAEAYLGQEGPYEVDVAVPHGKVSHTGDSVMEITGMAKTDPFCQKLKMDIWASRESETYNAIGANFMDSKLKSNADFKADISGASNSFGVKIRDIDSYKAESEGRLQVGKTEIEISGGDFGE